MPYTRWHFALRILHAKCTPNGNDFRSGGKTGWRALLAVAAGVALGVAGEAMAQSGGNGNGGAGGGNAHGAATAGPTAGGEKISAPESTQHENAQSKQKKKAKPATPPQ
ncbi:hypothetical protein AWB74_01337 [Caballeronia arvi]|uniref:Uncharacterized protein n=1 Tax=Caballeronia arvi TaxID=1777135 RepID=A0A158GG58_9BURK|nr:hypothetical protein AWB74_01337 [Caballeronia arvi]